MLRKKIVFLVLVLLLVQSASAFTKVTRFVPGRFNEKSLPLGISVNQSQVHTFNIELPHGSELVSIKMSGRITGKGRVMAVLDNNGTGLEIFNLNGQETDFAGAVTGVFTDVENALTGSAVINPEGNMEERAEFTSECIDTCEIDIPNKERVDVSFVVEDGTSVEIESMEYGFIPPKTKRASWLSGLFSKILNIFS